MNKFLINLLDAFAPERKKDQLITQLQKQIEAKDKIIANVQSTTLNIIDESMRGEKGTVILIFKQKLDEILRSSYEDPKQYDKAMEKINKKKKA